MAAEDAKLEAMFTLIDKNGDGQINAAELQEALAMSGIHMSMVDCRRVVQDADTNGNGTLNLSEFKAWTNASNPASTSTPQQQQVDSDLRRMFAVFDENGDGRISTMELYKALQIMGAGLSYRETEQLMRIADTNRDGMIDFNEFKKLMSDVIASQRPPAQPPALPAPQAAPQADSKVRRVFTAFDEDGDGKINARELYKGLQMLGISLSMQEVMALMRQADTNNDGLLDFLEFSKVIQIS